MDETNSIGPRLFAADGKAVAQARVSVFRRADTSSTPVVVGHTLVDGRFEIPSVPDGLYRVIARTEEGRVALQDSVEASEGTLRVHDDSLHVAGALKGQVSVGGDVALRSVVVSLVGSDLRTSPDSSGAFLLKGIGAGAWTMRIAGEGLTEVQQDLRAEWSKEISVTPIVVQPLPQSRP